MLRSSTLLSILLLSGCVAGAPPTQPPTHTVAPEPDLSAEEFRSEVAASWHAWTRRLTEAAGEDPDLHHEAAVEWVGEDLRAEILGAVRGDLELRLSRSLALEDVSRAWSEREGGRPRRAGYGAGTWLLGESAARAPLETEARAVAPVQAPRTEREDLEGRIERYLAARMSRMPHRREAYRFWRDWTAAERARWLLAYYVERGGDMHLLEVRLDPCVRCDGTGVEGFLDARVGRSHVLECGLCRHIGVQRSVSYR